MKKRVLLSLCVLLALYAPALADDAPLAVSIKVDAAKPLGPFHAISRFFGADEPNYATMPYGQKLIKEIGQLGSEPAYFRAHNLLCTGDGTPALKWGSTNAYTEDDKGNPVYDWKIVDNIFDTYIKNGVRPYAQIGFMPKALSTHPDPYQHSYDPTKNYGSIYTGWSYPPTDYKKWGDLSYEWVKHCVDKWGKDEVNKWYWEVWNEPNIAYWHGSPEDFMKLHDYAIDGVRRALPTAKVGGPDAAGFPQPWMRNFLDHCLTGTNYATGKTGTPIDFVSFHAKGAPTFTDGHVRMGISNQLGVMNGAFRYVANNAQLKEKPLIIGESDPDGCAACLKPELGYRNTTLFSSYTAEVFSRKQQLAAQYGVNLEGAITWAFEFETAPFFAGFRTIATNGIDMPVFNVFRMFGKMGGDRVDLQSSADVTLDAIVRRGVRTAPDISGMATSQPGKLVVMLWYYHDDDVAGPEANVALSLAGLTNGPAQIDEYRIDSTHSNAYTAWQKMDSPAKPTPEQYKQLEAAGQLQASAPPKMVTVENGAVNLNVTMARQAVVLLVVQSKPAAP